MPRVLVIAPLSGHRSVLFHDVIAGLLPDHDVHLTDWSDAREVPLAAGTFGLEENVAHVRDLITELCPGLHVVALCQAAVPAMAAMASAAAANPAAQPDSLTLISGIVDPRVAPTRVARLLRSRPLAWFERRALVRVPPPHAGAGRLVYPWFLQSVALRAYLFRQMREGGEVASKMFADDGDDPLHFPFQALYFSVMDLTAEFFLDNIDQVFQRATLPRGLMRCQGETVDLRAVTKPALLTIAGSADDVAGAAQLDEAHKLLSGVPPARHEARVYQGVGHFGTFHGRHWRNDILPTLRRFIRASETRQ